MTLVLSRFSAGGRAAHDSRFEPGVHLVSGVSGSGKTTWMLSLCGARSNASGVLRLGSDWYDLQRTADRRSLFFDVCSLHAHETFLLNELTVSENLNLPQMMGRKPVDAMGSCPFWVDLFEIQGLLKRYPSSLSQGEAQRVAVARALIHSRKIVLLDEPFVHLQAALKNRLLQALFDICRQKNAYIFVSSHDPQIMDNHQWQSRIEFEVEKTQDGY